MTVMGGHVPRLAMNLCKVCGGIRFPSSPLKGWLTTKPVASHYRVLALYYEFKKNQVVHTHDDGK